MVSSHNAARLRKSPQTGMSFSDARNSLILAHSCPGETIIGIASIAEYLERAGYRVRIVNLAVRMLRNDGFDVEKFIAKLEAPAFGIDLHWMVH